MSMVEGMTDRYWTRQSASGQSWFVIDRQKEGDERKQIIGNFYLQADADKFVMYANTMEAKT